MIKLKIKLYSRKNESTRKMRKFMEENNVGYIEKSIDDEVLTWEELIEILEYTEKGVEDILATRSLDYKYLKNKGVDFEEMKLSEFYKVITDYPKLLKTPIVTGKHTVIIGYNEEETSVLMSRENRKIELEKLLGLLDELDEDLIV